MTTGTRECGVCWWVYDPATGDDDAAIPPGVPFEDLGETYSCPRCQAPKERFLRPAADPIDALVAAYRAINSGMRDLPIHNPRLAVEAVGFRRSGDVLVGALVTPWFLNIVILGSPLPPAGESVTVSLPGGQFTAMGASPAGLDHLAIALLSPVDTLVDQAAARAVAEESLRLVLTAEPTAQPSTTTAPPKPPVAVGRRGLLRGLLGG